MGNKTIMELKELKGHLLPKPFPFYPPNPSEDELKRMEVMMELNKWANNDAEIAKRTAETLILLLGKQFGINVSIGLVKTPNAQ
jgi:hypothetical protein